MPPVQIGPLTSVPVLLLPEESATVVPPPSLKLYAATGPVPLGGLLATVRSAALGVPSPAPAEGLLRVRWIVCGVVSTLVSICTLNVCLITHGLNLSVHAVYT